MSSFSLMPKLDDDPHIQFKYIISYTLCWARDDILQSREVVWRFILKTICTQYYNWVAFKVHKVFI